MESSRKSISGREHVEECSKRAMGYMQKNQKRATLQLSLGTTPPSPNPQAQITSVVCTNFASLEQCERHLH